MASGQVTEVVLIDKGVGGDDDFPVRESQRRRRNKKKSEQPVQPIEAAKPVVTEGDEEGTGEQAKKRKRTRRSRKAGAQNKEENGVGADAPPAASATAAGPVSFATALLKNKEQTAKPDDAKLGGREKPDPATSQGKAQGKGKPGSASAAHESVSRNEAARGPGGGSVGVWKQREEYRAWVSKHKDAKAVAEPAKKEKVGGEMPTTGTDKPSEPAPSVSKPMSWADRLKGSNETHQGADTAAKAETDSTENPPPDSTKPTASLALAGPTLVEATAGSAKGRSKQNASIESKPAAPASAQPSKNKKKGQFHFGELFNVKMIPSKKESQNASNQKVVVGTFVPYVGAPSAKAGVEPRDRTKGKVPLADVVGLNQRRQTRGKEREKTKVKKPSRMKRVILEHREAQYLEFLRQRDGEDSIVYLNWKAEIEKRKSDRNEFGAASGDEEEMDDDVESSGSDESVNEGDENDGHDDEDGAEGADGSSSEVGPGESESRRVVQVKGKKPKMVDVAVQTGEIQEIQKRMNVPKPAKRRLRAYVNQKVTDDINKKAAELLELLTKFQERVRANEPMKFKMKRRYVCGLREVKRAIKNKRAKALIVAYNIEECDVEGGLNDFVEGIIEQAEENDIAVIYALSRNNLGRALGKTIRISCVAIFNYDGAHEVFKSCHSLALDAREQWTIDQKRLAERQEEHEKAEKNAPGPLPASEPKHSPEPTSGVDTNADASSRTVLRASAPEFVLP